MIFSISVTPGSPSKCASQVRSVAPCARAVAKMIASAVASLCSRHASAAASAISVSSGTTWQTCVKAMKHLDGAAFDIAMTNHDPVAFEAAAREVGFLGFGFYPRSGFMHVDLGPVRQWGERFLVRATAFAAETPPAREVLADSRTMKGGGAAGVATLGAAGVEVAQSVLAETQTAILPLVPYLDTLRWVFIAVALGGIAVTIYARLDDWRRGRR